MMLINAFSLYSQYDCGMALGSLSDGKVGLHYPDYPTRGERRGQRSQQTRFTPAQRSSGEGTPITIKLSGWESDAAQERS